jgi:hypothetical protein
MSHKNHFFFSLARLWTFRDTWWNLWEHHDDWKNFNTVQINLKDGQQTKRSKATPWTNGTEQPNARVPVPCGGRAQQMEGMSKWSLIGLFSKTIMWHYFGYGIGCGSISPECLPPAIFWVLTRYNVQLLWSFLCTTKLIQRLLYSMHTPQFSHNMPLGWICLVMHGYPGSIRKLKKKPHCHKHHFQCSTSILSRKKNLGRAFQ